MQPGGQLGGEVVDPPLPQLALVLARLLLVGCGGGQRRGRRGHLLLALLQVDHPLGQDDGSVARAGGRRQVGRAHGGSLLGGAGSGQLGGGCLGRRGRAGHGGLTRRLLRLQRADPGQRGRELALALERALERADRGAVRRQQAAQAGLVGQPAASPASSVGSSTPGTAARADRTAAWARAARAVARPRPATRGARGAADRARASAWTPARCESAAASRAASRPGQVVAPQLPRGQRPALVEQGAGGARHLGPRLELDVGGPLGDRSPFEQRGEPAAPASARRPRGRPHRGLRCRDRPPRRRRAGRRTPRPPGRAGWRSAGGPPRPRRRPGGAARRARSRRRRTAGCRRAGRAAPGAPRRRPAGSAAKSPWGSSTTWQNCSRLMPSSCGDLLADLLVRAADGPVQAPAPARTRAAGSAPCSVVVPRAALLGPLPLGGRVISSRRPPTVSSRRTSVRVPGAAWSLRSRGRPPAGRRAPGRTGRSRRRPGRRSCPPRSGRAAGRARRRTARRSRPAAVPANGPKAVTSQPVQPHRGVASAARGVAGRDRVERVRAAAPFVRRPAPAPRTWATKSSAISWSAAAAQPRGVRRGRVRRRRRSGSKTRRGCAGTARAAGPSARRGRTGSVRVASTQAPRAAASAGSASRSSSRPAQPGERARHRGSRRARAATAPSRAEVDQPHALAVVRPRRRSTRSGEPRVAHPLGERSGSRAGGRAPRSRRRRRPSAGTAATPPTVMSRSLSLACAAGDEGVRERRRERVPARPAGQVGADPVHGGAEHRRVVRRLGARARPRTRAGSR